jgi:hypothetical protein
LELTVDGRKSRIACGPVRKDGGFDLVIKQRHKGQIIEAGEIIGRAMGNILMLKVCFDKTQGLVRVAETERD